MAENRRFFPLHQQLDLRQILQEAQNRWLRPTEICEVLRNHQKFQLTPQPPVKPSAGSLFLFDRKVLRYFRKDGHRWRKKKDGKTVKEAHEKLKAGSVDVLHCYYAHGEDNENFQRRSYWMLDESLEHIVLVHYREVKEGYKSGVSRLHHADPGPQIESPQASSAAFLTHGNLLDATSQEQSSFISSPKTFSWVGNIRNAELGNGEDSGAASLGKSIHDREASLLTDFGVSSIIGYPDSTRADFYRGTGQSSGPAIRNSLSEVHTVNDKSLYNEQSSGADLIGHNLTSRIDIGLQDLTFGDGLIPSIDITSLKHDSHRPFQMLEGHESRSAQTQFQHISDSSMIITPDKAKIGSNEIAKNDVSVELKKLDSFGRWMDKEIGGDCDDSLMASDSGNYWNTIDAQNGEKEVSSLSRHMQLDVDSLGPSLSQEQLFSIDDFSPDWAYSGVETKVLVVGKFLGDKTHSTGAKWSCMFGEIEVSAEVLGENVIRCYAPLHSPGRMPFYITCSNRLACSEVREFEYIEKPLNPGERKGVPEDEVGFRLRLAKMLCSPLQRNWTDCSIEDCDKCKLKKQIYSVINDSKNKFGRTNEALSYLEADSNHLTDVLIEELLKDRLPEWLVSKVHEGGKGPHVLDEKGLGVIHLAAALGYEWAMSSIVAARISPNFRDARGRTGLHWASYYGREETVSELIRLGAAPGAVDDPTSEFPGGQTAADLASCRGYKGIAGYLAEADLTEHLSLLSVNGNALDSVAATISVDKAIKNAAEVVASNGASDEQKSLRGSLAAVRNSVQAAALIHAAFRARSFHHRQFIESKTDGPEALADLVAQGSLNKVQKISHFEDYLHCAALKIQRKYRGWKGRKDFLQIRSRIVKIQAHVRGHQVRKQYKRVVWSVSIVEKVILRWRRGGTGLRGFRVDKDVNAVPESEKTDEYDFLRIGRKQKFAGVERALARVQSMVRQPDARDQYMRMVSKFQNFKMNEEKSSS